MENDAISASEQEAIKSLVKKLKELQGSLTEEERQAFGEMIELAHRSPQQALTKQRASDEEEVDLFEAGVIQKSQSSHQLFITKEVREIFGIEND